MSYYLPQRVVTSLLNRFLPSNLIETFNQWVFGFDGVVAGSATAWMVAQSHQFGEPSSPSLSWEPNDLDVWISINDNKSAAFYAWFKSHDFVHTTSENGWTNSEHYTGVCRSEFTVTTMNHLSGKYKPIQIMVLADVDPILFIYDHFDLTVVLNFWNGKQLWSEWVDLTRSQKMAKCKIYNHFQTILENNRLKREARLKKFQERGFQLIDVPAHQSGMFSKIHIISEDGNKDVDSNDMCSRIAGLQITL